MLYMPRIVYELVRQRIAGFFHNAHLGIMRGRTRGGTRDHRHRPSIPLSLDDYRVHRQGVNFEI